MDCLFCKIVTGDIPSNKVYEDDKILAFYDIAPQAPIHILIIPRVHIACADELNKTNSSLIAHIFATIPAIAKQAGLKTGYRIITNSGEDGCQSVKHLHFHLLGGRKLTETMG